MTTAINQSQHLMKSYVKELLYRKDYSTENRAKLLILGSLYLEEFNITQPSESKMSIIVEKKRVLISIIHHQRILKLTIRCYIKYVKMCFESCLPCLLYN